MSNYQRTAKWLAACGKTTSHEDASVQAGCHIEEFCELLSCVRVDKDGYGMLIQRCMNDLNWLAEKLKRGELTAYIPPHLRVDALDALCDCEVTGNGLAYTLGFSKEAADDAVLDSNDRKLVDGKPVLKPGGKIGKPEGWVPPDLTNFV